MLHPPGAEGRAGEWGMGWGAPGAGHLSVMVTTIVDCSLGSRHAELASNSNDREPLDNNTESPHAEAL